jgi:S1-C subfamily serine protease
MRQLAALGRVVYGFLGVTTENLTPTLARHLGYQATRGAIVSSVKEGSPADRGGIHGGTDSETFNGQTVTSGGDVIVAIDGRVVRSAEDVVRQVAEKLPGQTVALTVVRGNTRNVIRVELGERPAQPGVNP